MDLLSPIELSSDSDSAPENGGASEVKPRVQRYDAPMFEASSWPPGRTMLDTYDVSPNSATKRTIEGDMRPRKVQRTTSDSPHGECNRIGSVGDLLQTIESNGNVVEDVDTKPDIKVERNAEPSPPSDGPPPVAVKQECQVKVEPKSQSDDGDAASDSADTKEPLQALMAEIKQEYVAPLQARALPRPILAKLSRGTFVHRKTIKTEEPIDVVKGEPVSSTNDAEPCAMQARASAEFENDPEAGPSGLSAQPAVGFEVGRNLFHRYPHDSTDDESDEDREIATSLWRSREAYTANVKGQVRDLPWRLRQTSSTDFTAPRADTPANVFPMVDVVDLSETDAAEPPVKPPSPHRAIEILTAPDLQLDWLSEDDALSTDDEIICTTDLPENPPAMAAANQTAPLNSPSTWELSPIDLTTTDDEDNATTSTISGSPNAFDATAAPAPPISGGDPALAAAARTMMDEYNFLPLAPRSRYDALNDRLHDSQCNTQRPSGTVNCSSVRACNCAEIRWYVTIRLMNALQMTKTHFSVRRAVRELECGASDTYACRTCSAATRPAA